MTAKAGSASEVLIRTPDQRLRVFVSSALAELADERRAVSSAISVEGSRLNLRQAVAEVRGKQEPGGE